jgi:uncharacterized surface protein with fasciclin (FAS1) repeats
LLNDLDKIIIFINFIFINYKYILMKLVKSILSLVVLGVVMASCGGEKKSKETTTTDTTVVVTDTVQVAETPNIVSVADANADFSTLVAAVKAANLVETLSGEGPFTVFAPTNAAFEKLPAGTVETLLKPENAAKLTALLTYHVVSGKFEAAAVIEAITKNNGKFTVTTVQGGKIDLTLKDGKVILTDAKGGMSTVILADVAASNGVIHAIDSVVMPK